MLFPKNCLLYIIFVLQTTLCTKMNKQSPTTREWEEKREQERELFCEDKISANRYL